MESCMQKGMHGYRSVTSADEKKDNKKEQGTSLADVGEFLDKLTDKSDELVKQWKSLRKGKENWAGEEVASCATMAIEALGATMVGKILCSKFTGSKILDCPEIVTAKACCQNHVLLAGALKHSPMYNRTSYFYADAFLFINLLLDKKLLVRL